MTGLGIQREGLFDAHRSPIKSEISGLRCLPLDNNIEIEDLLHDRKKNLR